MNKPINATLFADGAAASTVFTPAKDKIADIPEVSTTRPLAKPKVEPRVSALVELLATAAKPKPDDDEDAFNWQRDKDEICIEHQPAVAVYRGGAGHVVVRQESPDGHDEDDVLLVTLDNLPALITKLQTFLPGKPGRGSR